MMDHVLDKPRDINWDVIQSNVVKFLLDVCSLSDKFTADDVNHVAGVLEVNAFEVVDQGPGRGVFPLTALMSHSCICNTR